MSSENASPDAVFSDQRAPLSSDLPTVTFDTPAELVFGLVGPTGVDLDSVCESLKSHLAQVGYETKIVSLSSLIFPYLGKGEIKFKDEFERVWELMTAGTSLRRESEQPDIVARLGLAKIRALRSEISGNPLKHPDRAIAYIVRSFKRPEEVELYRIVYGKAFTLISAYAPREARKNNMTRKLATITGQPEVLAVQLISRDHIEEGELGQKVSATFPLADFFVTTGARTQLDTNIGRLIRLTFNDPYISPSKDEQGMFFAQAAALRSLDLSRQVGVSITSDDGDVISTGCNEVPKFGGGLYWADDVNVARDFELGCDSNTLIKEELVADAIGRLRAQNWLSPSLRRSNDQALAASALYGEEAFFHESRMFDVIEFGRAVHAEMAAITQAAKLGTSLRGSILYSTTFPCHLCARHIVASGIADVVFVEPYEKSRTEQLYSDSISVEPQETSQTKVNFRAFVGVAPRRYMDFFSANSKRKDSHGKILKADSVANSSRIKRIVFTYLLVEELMVKGTKEMVKAQPGLFDAGEAK